MSKNNKNSNSLFDFFDSLINKSTSSGTTIPSSALGSHTSPTFPVHRVVSPPLSFPTYGRYASGLSSAGSMFVNYTTKYHNFDIVNIEDFKKFKLEGMVFHDNIIMTFEDFYNRIKPSVDEHANVINPSISVKVPCNCFVCEEKARLAESLAELKPSQVDDVQDKLDLIELYKQQIQNSMTPVNQLNNTANTNYGRFGSYGVTLGSAWTPIGSATPSGIRYNPKDIYTASGNGNIPGCQNTYNVNFDIFNDNIEEAFKLVVFIVDTHDSNKHLVNPRSYNQDAINLYIKRYNLEKYSKDYELKHKANDGSK